MLAVEEQWLDRSQPLDVMDELRDDLLPVQRAKLRHAGLDRSR